MSFPNVHISKESCQHESLVSEGRNLRKKFVAHVLTLAFSFQPVLDIIKTNYK